MGSFALAVSQMRTLRLSTVRQLSQAFQQVLMANKEKTGLSVASPKKVIQMQLRGFPRSSGEVSMPSLPRVQIQSPFRELFSTSFVMQPKKKRHYIFLLAWGNESELL